MFCNICYLIQHPHPKETERIAQGRYQVLVGYRQMGKLSDKETIQLLEDLKRNMTPEEKVLIFYQFK